MRRITEDELVALGQAVRAILPDAEWVPEGEEWVIHTRISITGADE